MYKVEIETPKGTITLKEIKGLLNQYNKQVREVKIKNLSIMKRGVSNGTNKNK